MTDKAGGLHFDAPIDRTITDEVRDFLLAALGGLVDERVYVLGAQVDYHCAKCGSLTACRECVLADLQVMALEVTGRGPDTRDTPAR